MCVLFFKVAYYYHFLVASVIGIYGLIVGVILAQSIDVPTGARENVYSSYSAMAHVSVASELCVSFLLANIMSLMSCVLLLLCL